MRKAAVLGTMKGKGCRWDLLDATQTLKFCCVDKIINHAVIDRYIIVNRITKYFFIHAPIIPKNDWNPLIKACQTSVPKVVIPSVKRYNERDLSCNRKEGFARLMELLIWQMRGLCNYRFAIKSSWITRWSGLTKAILLP